MTAPVIRLHAPQRRRQQDPQPLEREEDTGPGFIVFLYGFALGALTGVLAFSAFLLGRVG